MKNIFGYLLGFLLFIAGIPAIMWWVSGRPFPWAPAWPWAVIAALLMMAGLFLSVWAIVHMKKVGEGMFSFSLIAVIFSVMTGLFMIIISRAFYWLIGLSKTSTIGFRALSVRKMFLAFRIS